MATKCEMDKKGVLLFPKVVNGRTHAEYVSSRSRINLTLNRGTQVIDLCGRVSPIRQPVNSEASVIEALVGCANIMTYRSDIRYLMFYVASFQKWQTCNNILRPLQAAVTSQCRSSLSFRCMCNRLGTTVKRSASPHTVL